MLHDKHRLSGQGRGFVVAHNLKGNRIDDWVRQLKENETHRKRRRKDSVIITHEMLSWHKDDVRNMTPQKMEAMTREYIRLRGSRGVYLAVPHFDRGHWHVHILVAGVEYKTGKAMRMSRKELADLKKNIQQYQVRQYPELSHSVVQHGRKAKSRVSEKEYQLKARTKKLTKREEVSQLVYSCYTQASSTEDFYARLKACKLPTYVRGGRVYGVVSEGKKYRFKTIGISLEKSEAVQKTLDRGKELRAIRRKKGKGRERTI